MLKFFFYFTNRLKAKEYVEIFFGSCGKIKKIPMLYLVFKTLETIFSRFASAKVNGYYPCSWTAYMAIYHSI